VNIKIKLTHGYLRVIGYALVLALLMLAGFGTGQFVYMGY
jgi:hypothetical protein